MCVYVFFLRAPCNFSPQLCVLNSFRERVFLWLSNERLRSHAGLLRNLLHKRLAKKRVIRVDTENIKRF